VIKFRCARCGQKIAVNDEGADAVIACTTCAESLVVPPETIAEFRQPTTSIALPVPVVVENRWQDPLTRAEHSAESATEAIRAGLLPHLARLMMDKLVQTLLKQRGQLLQTQQVGTDRMVDLERRVIRVQEHLQQRIDDLEAELAAKEDENRELMQNNYLLTQYLTQAEHERDSAQAHANLGVDLLLRT
jgi:DNA-directed RNA polymerase subunit RPC12/RpoP